MRDFLKVCTKIQIIMLKCKTFSCYTPKKSSYTQNLLKLYHNTEKALVHKINKFKSNFSSLSL